MFCLLNTSGVGRLLPLKSNSDAAFSKLGVVVRNSTGMIVAGACGFDSHAHCCDYGGNCSQVCSYVTMLVEEFQFDGILFE